MQALTFLGPIHHLNTLAPIIKALEARGVQNRFYTANAEACFEHALSQTLGNEWEWLPLYEDEKRQARTYEDGVAYFRQLYRTPSVVSHIVAYIIDRILKELSSDVWATKRLIESRKPDLCLALHEINRWGMLLGFWSAVKGIPYYTVQEGMYYSPPTIYTGHTKYSTSLIWGAATKRKLMAAGCPEEKLIVVGHPGLKSRWEDAASKREQALAMLPESFRDKPLCLLYITNVGSLAMDAGHILEDFEQTGYRLIVRLAVMASIPLIEQVQRLFKGHEHVAFVSPPVDDMALPLADLCDPIVIIGCSTLGLESLWRGKRLVEVPNRSGPFWFGKQAGVAVDASEPQPARNWLTAAEEFYSKEENLAKVRAFVEDEIIDAEAAPKMADWILERRKA